jgi:hypothetical protein
MSCRKCGAPTRRRLCRDCELFERHDAEHTVGGTGSDAPDDEEETDDSDTADEPTDTESTHD